jgi:hypothetical protein
VNPGRPGLPAALRASWRPSRETSAGPDGLPAVRLRACPASFAAADAIAAEAIGPTTARGVERDAFLKTLGD